jgi:hypothetical protein
MKYRKQILVVLLLVGFAARAEDKPEAVVQQFIDHAVAGRTNEAASCYAISNEAQRQQVETRLQKYMPAVMAGEERAWGRV